MGPADPWGAASASPKSVETSASQPHPAENYAPAPSPPKNAGPANSDFLRRFAQGANLPIDTLAARDAGDLAEEIGQLLNAMAANIMQLLNARAAAKTLSRSGHRTLIQSTENNPLKFMPTPEEALRVMLGAKSTSYLGGRQSVEGGFADLKMHQMATLSAMQLAVTRLLADLSPDAVKTAAEGGRKSLLGANKGKFWDQFVDMWAAKAAHHDHGMLGAYMELFAEIYDTESRPKNQ